MDIEKPDSDYIILESMTNSSAKAFYIINTENKQQLKIGRGQDCDVRVTDDISVSRCHAIIKKTSKGEYYLEDCNSKFGTLVQVLYPIQISPENYSTQPLVLQAGKTCLTIKMDLVTTCMPQCLTFKRKRLADKLVSYD